MSHGWKYGMILVGWRTLDGLVHDPVTDEDEKVCMLVELFPNEAGEYRSYCEASIESPEDLRLALKDVERDGINTWFHEHGTFSWGTQRDIADRGYRYTWKPNDPNYEGSFSDREHEVDTVPEELMKEWEKQYPGKTVAFAGEEVVAVFDDFLSFIQNVPPGCAAVTFPAKGPDV